MLKVSENITMQGSVTIENRIIVNMSATITTVENAYPNININILDKNTYKDNYDTCKSGISEFVEKVLSKELEALGGKANEIK
ncbi:MAG: hypothetical protein SPH93_16160 [Clostridium sp.]|uniref:hypothetical protein n=1 Tax=Clostridium sp. TaxID=1506 RepID=UPI002A752734|nr:hypothetical protein [Clostridium sp.]MDY2632371.1 hypothetical protein [Clostridium sp.]MDY6229167.1 hypothetical protein [Clostridium sp.]